MAQSSTLAMRAFPKQDSTAGVFPSPLFIGLYEEELVLGPHFSCPARCQTSPTRSTHHPRPPPGPTEFPSAILHTSTAPPSTSLCPLPLLPSHVCSTGPRKGVGGERRPPQNDPRCSLRRVCRGQKLLSKNILPRGPLRPDLCDSTSSDCPLLRPALSRALTHVPEHCHELLSDRGLYVRPCCWVSAGAVNPPRPGAAQLPDESSHSRTFDNRPDEPETARDLRQLMPHS